VYQPLNINNFVLNFDHKFWQLCKINNGATIYHNGPDRKFGMSLSANYNNRAIAFSQFAEIVVLRKTHTIRLPLFLFFFVVGRRVIQIFEEQPRAAAAQ